jgi:hypothetical protein
MYPLFNIELNIKLVAGRMHTLGSFFAYDRNGAEYGLAALRHKVRDSRIERRLRQQATAWYPKTSTP